MGEEEKKAAEKKEDPPSAGGGDEKKAEGEAKPAEESKDAPPPPPPPPQEIVLRVFMHCEGCARKVRRCLKDFDGVEDVVTDCKTHKVVVKGEKADPVKVLERVQKKSHRQVELLSPIPAPAPPPEEEPKKPPEEVAKPEEKKEEPQVITVVLKAHMHCEACAEAIKKRILRMKGVENVEPDFKGSQVTVRGVFDPQNLVDYVAKKTGKRAVVVKVEPKKEEAAGEEEKKAAEEGKAEEGKKGGNGDGGEKKEGESGGGEKKEGDGEGVELAEDPKMEMKKHELYYSYYPPIQVNNNPHYHHHQRFVAAQDGGGYGYGYPQMFSDENPNACSVM